MSTEGLVQPAAASAAAAKSGTESYALPQGVEPRRIEIPGGTADVYFWKFESKDAADSPRQDVLSNGKLRFRDELDGVGGTEVGKHNLVVDVHTAAKAGEAHSLFNRDGNTWSRIEPGARAVQEYVEGLYHEADLKDKVQRYSNLRTMELVDPLNPTRVSGEENAIL